MEHVRDNFDCYISALEELIAKNQLDTRCHSHAHGQGSNLGLKIGGRGCELILPDKRAWLEMPRPH